ncbi:DUF6548 family protein [Proteinivorax hydrogeniformans]|uniref:DUF6548 family protein n=1 Tax=Proteinivorax hydrogeniformans TaxID=1826727 RepID=A0AAU8HR44_9FIRM
MAKQLSNADKFLDVYNELDKFMRQRLNAGDYKGHTKLLEEMKQRYTIVNSYYEELKDYAKLRNAIVHESKEGVKPIAEPHDITVKNYYAIAQTIINPPKALEKIAVSYTNIFTATLKDNALEIMEKMHKHTFTHVPVVDEDDKLLGIFSENTVFSYLVEHRILETDQDNTIEEFADFLPIEKHKSEYFEFVPKSTLVMDIEEMFKQGLKDDKRISVIFITENGKKEEKILGLITPWDVAGYDGICFRY